MCPGPALDRQTDKEAGKEMAKEPASGKQAPADADRTGEGGGGGGQRERRREGAGRFQYQGQEVGEGKGAGKGTAAPVSAGQRRPTPVGVRSLAGDGRRPDGRVPRIAVLGAGGFLGSHLVPALLAGRECEIDAVDIDLGKLAPAEGVRRIQARLDRPGLIEELVDRCEVIISLTALCNPSLYNTQPLAVIDASYTDLVPVVKLCTTQRRWLIHFSTCEVYGRRALDNLGAPMPAMREDESALWLGPVHLERWSYACAKQLLERVIFASGRHHGLPFTIVRPFNVIGPRMDFVPGVDGEGVPGCWRRSCPRCWR
jgi:hypothetical protein